MAKYVVNEGKRVNAGEGIWFEAGETVELAPEDASGMVENGTVSSVGGAPAAPAPAPRVVLSDDESN